MEAVIGPLMPLTFVLMLVFERVCRAKQSPKIRWWLVKGVLGFVFLAFMNAALPAFLLALLGDHAPLHLRLGTVPGALVALLVVDLVNYWIHRFMHRVTWLWRWTHQMHHSAERMDLAGLAYSHPFDSITTFGATALIIFALGVSPEAGALAGFLQFLGAVLTHLNVRTPAWLGYFVSRPEQHALHHARDIHAYNYAQLPIWDIVFRTFRNPKRGEFPEHYGFWEGASSQLGPMLLGRDVGRRGALRAGHLPSQ